MVLVPCGLANTILSVRPNTSFGAIVLEGYSICAMRRNFWRVSIATWTVFEVGVVVSIP
jgi:hypothetical protein